MRFLATLFLTVAVTGFTPVLAQQSQPMPPRLGQTERSQPTPRQQPAPPAESQRRVPDIKHQSRVDQLFERLAASGTEREANGYAEQISRIWDRSGSDTLDLIMERAKQALAGGDSDLSLDLIDSVMALKADWAEAYNRRAAVHFQRKDFDAAMRDLRQALVLEPRHFQAVAGIGLIYQQSGNPKKALAAFREALKLHPHLKGIKESATRMAVEHDPQDL
jgi:tetratricopeptide (TPR) repeat protein